VKGGLDGETIERNSPLNNDETGDFSFFLAYLTQRLHDKRPLLHHWVRDGERGGLDGQIVVEQDVNVNGTVVVDGSGGRNGRDGSALGGVAVVFAQEPFNALGGTQQAVRGELGVYADDSVDKGVVRLEPPWLRIVESRLAHDVANLLCYQCNSPPDVLFPVAQVRAQS